MVLDAKQVEMLKGRQLMQEYKQILTILNDMQESSNFDGFLKKSNFLMT